MPVAARLFQLDFSHYTLVLCLVIASSNSDSLIYVSVVVVFIISIFFLGLSQHICLLSFRQNTI